ncbi:uncharacterized protein N7458_002656 [Penicillium daleae]|uniref:Nnf1-domain-containing protein n=1 Tax=Penicillium daleae TaxID=63821 RepID=A0AAD6CDW7_9EURO|nr:uncharacterized protein N7458_002656 [Penicillium daleae]KAJ5461104.1 hypothetical protein N7458_002656 [Penicillium daleae]
MPPSQEQLAAISITERVCSTVSLVGAFVIVTTFILWCWVSLPWDILRIGVFYGPVWFVISLTFAIYLRAGSVIYEKRRQLRALDNIDSLDTETATHAPLVNLAGIQVTSEIACSRPERRSIAAPEVHVPVPVPVPVRSFSLPTFTPYSVSIEGGMMDPISMHQNSEEQLPPIHASRAKLDPRMSITSSSKCRSEGVERHSQRRGSNEPISAAWAYTKYAMLFFIALLVTWVPSTVNRVPTPQPKITSASRSHAHNTMAGPNSHPPPTAPTTDNPAQASQTPGLRASRLHQVFDQALARTLRANSYANFSGCFPTPARHVPASLESVWRQLNAKLEESAKAEFEEILEEREAVAHLNELDRLVAEAKVRKEKGKGNGEERGSGNAPHTLGAEQLYKAHLTPYLQEAQATLNGKLDETHAQNAELAQTVQAQRREIEKLLAQLESVVTDIEGAATAATEFSKEHHIRQDAVQMDREVNARPDV